MCKVSIIVPVYNVERYLRTCMDSLVHQTMSEIEIIAVNDGSPDNSLNILKEYEAAYASKVTVYSIENHGVSYARNYGADRAKGEYLLFVDSDDYVEPQYCEKMYRKAETDQNDLVLCSRNNIYEGRSKECTKEPYEMMTAGQNFSIEAAPYELVWLSPFPWDKLVRRELFLQIRFPENIRFEDLAYVLKLACICKSIGVIREPLYNYRRTSSGGFLNNFSEATLDIVKAFEHVLGFMEEHGYDRRYYDELAYICARHFFFRYPALLGNQAVPEELKRRMILDTHAFLDKNFPDWKENHYLKYSSPPDIRNHLFLYSNKKKMLRAVAVPQRVLQYYLEKKKTWDCFKADFRRPGIPGKTRAITRQIRVLKLLHLPAAHEYTRAYEAYPVDPQLVFLESKHGEDIAGNVFQIIRELHAPQFRQFQIMLALDEKGQRRWEELAEVYGLHRVKTVSMRTPQYYKALASAGYLITDTSFPAYFVKKQQQTYLNTWHGTPLKAMGRIVPDREYGLGNVQRNFLIADYLLYQNEFSRDIFLKDYMLRPIYPGKIMLSGYPRNSALLKTELRSRIREEKQLEERHVIAYMPTWRGVLHQKEFNQQVLTMFQYLSEIDRGLTDRQVFYVKLHPFVDDTVDYSLYRHIRPFPAEYDTYDFLNAVDTLVTDYSSIMFDFGVTGRRIVLFTYDREEYLAERGMYLQLEELEFPKADTVEELLAELQKPGKEYPNFRKKFCSYDSAEAAKKVCRTLLLKEKCVKTESVLEGERRPNVLVYLDQVKEEKVFREIIRKLNRLDTEHYHYFLCFKSSEAKKHSRLLQELRPEIGYLPLQPGLNATKKEYICRALYFRGIRLGGIIRRPLRSLYERERQKHFGNASFAYVIYYNGTSSMRANMLGCLGGTKICNLTDFSPEAYRADPAYRRDLKTLVKCTIGFDAFCINEEFEKTRLYKKTKGTIAYRRVKGERYEIEDLMEV